jgi:hypothetical protein
LCIFSFKALILRVQSARKMSALNEKMHKWDAPPINTPLGTLSVGIVMQALQIIWTI